MLNSEISLRSSLTVRVKIVDTVKDEQILERRNMETCLEEQRQSQSKALSCLSLRVENEKNDVQKPTADEDEASGEVAEQES